MVVRLPGSVEDRVPHGDRHGLRLGVRLQLQHGARGIKVHGAGAQLEDLGGLGGGLALGGPHQNFTLPTGQCHGSVPSAFACRYAKL